MENNLIIDKTGEDGIFQETISSENYANYTAYLKLTDIGYTKAESASHLSLTEAQLDALQDEFDPGDE